MSRKTTILLFSLSLSALLFSCDDKETPRPDLVIPTTYADAGFDANTTSQKALLAQLKALVDEVKKGRTPGTTLSQSTLISLFQTGSPNLSIEGTSYFAEKLQSANGWLAEAAKASGGTYTPGTPAGEGGVFGTPPNSIYLFDENGLEPEQLIEKGQFGSLLYHKVSELATGSLSLEKTDQMLALFGGNPTFPNTSNASKAAKPDAFFSVYVARRDKNDGNGFYSQLKANFIKLQAAIKAGEAYNFERDAAAKEIRTILEKANGATIINYCHSVISTMSKTTVTDSDKASALHSLSEAIGFAHGYLGIPANRKIITDAQINQILGLLQAPAEGPVTCYKVVTQPETELNKLTVVIQLVKGIYGFSDAQVEDFRKNWITEQGR